MRMIIALVMMTAPAFAAEPINKCIDKSGKVVAYGNVAECPAGSRAEKVEIKGMQPSAPAQSSSAAQPGAPAASPGQKSLADRDADFRKRQVEKQEAEAKAQKKIAEAERRKQACTESQSYLTSLKSGQRITRTDPKTGERAFLADNEYAGEIAKAQRAVDANCK